MTERSISEQLRDSLNIECNACLGIMDDGIADKVEEVEREARHTKRILAYLYIHADLAPHHRGMVNEALGYPSFDEMEEMSQ